MSSCNVTENTCAIRPANAGGSVFQESCNASSAGASALSPRLAHSSTGSCTCTIKRSCNAGGLRRLPRPYPGCAARQACVRATCTGSQKYWLFWGWANQAAWLAALLARRHAPAEQYRCRLRLRWSESNNSPQHKHLRCPACAIVAPRLGRAARPRRPRARQQAQSEQDGHQPRRRRVNDVEQKKTKDEEDARSLRLKKSRFVSALTGGTLHA